MASRLARLFRRALLSDLLRLDGILHRSGPGAHRNSVCGAFQAGFRDVGACLGGLRIRDGLDTVGFLALLGLGLFELAFGGQ